MRLAQEAGFTFAAPPAGLFGWIDTGVDSERLAQRLHAEGWLLTPGRLFYVGAAPPSDGAEPTRGGRDRCEPGTVKSVLRRSTLMRINFAVAQEARLWRVLREARQRLDGAPVRP